MKQKKPFTVFGLALAFGLCFGVSASAADGTTLENATTLSLNASAHTGTLKEETAEENWYRFKIPATIGNKWITVSCTNQAAEDSLDFALLDEEESELDSAYIEAGEAYAPAYPVADSIASSAADRDTAMEAGKTYYIRVSGSFSGASSHKFSLKLTTTADDNWGSIEQAPGISLSQQVTGTLEMTEDRDCFRFTIPDDEQTYFVTANASYNCEFKLVDETENEINFLSANTDGSFKDQMEITGTGEPYYLIVENVGPDHGKAKTTYSFSVSLDPNSVKPAASKKTISTLKVTAKKNTKKIKITTIKGGKITIALSEKIIKNGKQKVKKITKTAAKGTLTLTLSKKLKKKAKIKITVSKTGYTTKTKTVTVA